MGSLHHFQEEYCPPSALEAGFLSPVQPSGGAGVFPGDGRVWVTFGTFWVGSQGFPISCCYSSPALTYCWEPDGCFVLPHSLPAMTWVCRCFLLAQPLSVPFAGEQTLLEVSQHWVGSGTIWILHRVLLWPWPDHPSVFLLSRV